MKTVKPIAVLLILIFATLTGCTPSGGQSGLDISGSGTQGPPEISTAARTAVEIEDMTGRIVNLEAPAKRVVGLDAASCEILYALGAGEYLVGRGEYCDYPAQTQSVPMVQSGSSTNAEQIISLAPQAVIMSTMAQGREQVEALENAGIPVVVTMAQDIEGVYRAIELVGDVVGRREQADGLVAKMRSDFADIADMIPSLQEKPTVYFEVSPLEWGLWTAGGGTFMDEIAEMLGLENIFADVEGWGQISQEQIIQRNPDYIVTVAMYSGDGLRPEDEIMGREGWQGIEAVKNGRVIPADSDEITRPGPRLTDAARNLYSYVYAETER